MRRVRPRSSYVPLEPYEEEAWDGYAVAPRRRLTPREIDTVVFATAVTVLALGAVAAFWATRRR